ncbi:NAD(P)/FAD-dependent oxidoreductase [Natrialba asiatica]|uniref:FAD-dependent pyridine nucleotide-disulfide oxidoreductase n=1 Tax=Natrialba asiatica (strain ATCC 700177 / DSM 12278 / JCM 9576 / FERM P-10747 / NBRC 102637 / 172P1) TaxID=29540 RepID=M0AXD9_NATA1|nr:FAD-dependent oxidoreductase [Natrialba asiatica]ELZ02638.1 FAD-dependent pyridine nucleotide-disulfide oxidoreductase [Natrialba asiatica DSM 12278]
MPAVAIVGGGPAGLSAALFTAKNGLETVVFDTDETWMHKAHLFNYLGVRSLSGDEYLEIARGQVEDRGGSINGDESVVGIEQTDNGFQIETEAGEYEATYVVLATGADRSLAEELDLAFDDEDTVDVGLDMETSVDDLYATGAMVRAEEWQAVIAAGDGGAAALDILSKEKGEHFHDFDTPADVPSLSE